MLRSGTFTCATPIIASRVTIAASSSSLQPSVPGGVEVRVWDSTAELRYLVLPERPAGTEGWSEDELAEIVSRDAMIGVAQVKLPGRSER